MEKRKDNLWFSALLAIVLCVVLIVGGTWALFTDSVKVNNHLIAGSLEVGLKRVSYREYILDDTTGLMTDNVDEEEIDLTLDNKEIFAVDKAVPTSEYEATIEVSNLGSTAFDYSVCILWTNKETATEKDLAFASQMQITITSKKIADIDAKGQDEEGTNYVQFMLNECADPGNNISLGYLLKNTGTDSFTVKAEFINDDENNDAMLACLTFDIQVFATQKTSLEAEV